MTVIPDSAQHMQQEPLQNPTQDTPLSDPSLETPATDKKRFSWKSLLKPLFSVVLIAVLLHFTGFEGTLTRLSKANLWYIPVCVAVYLVAQAISTWRWKFLSEALNFRLSFRELYDYYLIGMFFNMFLPGSIGGDAMRLYYLARGAGRKKREALLTLLAERGVGLVALMLLSTAVCFTPELLKMSLGLPLHLPLLKPMTIDMRLVLMGFSSLMLLGYASLWLLPLERLAGTIKPVKLIIQAKVYWAHWGLLFKSVSISLAVHAMMVGLHLIMAEALGMHVSILYMTVVYGVVSLASVLPIAANGFGVREGIYWLFLTKIGFPKDTALAFAFYWDAVSLLTALIGGLVLIKGHYKTPQPADLEALAE